MVGRSILDGHACDSLAEGFGFGADASWNRCAAWWRSLLGRVAFLGKNVREPASGNGAHARVPGLSSHGGDIIGSVDGGEGGALWIAEIASCGVLGRIGAMVGDVCLSKGADVICVGAEVLNVHHTGGLGVGGCWNIYHIRFDIGLVNCFSQLVDAQVFHAGYLGGRALGYKHVVLLEAGLESAFILAAPAGQH